MQYLQNIETSVLVEMLATYTANFSKMLSYEGTKKEFEKCKEMIQVLQSEIQSRSPKQSFPNISDPGNNFNEATTTIEQTAEEHI